MRIMILGAGAVGGYFGAAMQVAGLDVTFLVRPGRAEKLAKDKLTVKSDILGEQAVTVKTLTNQEPSSDFDLILLTCKAYDLKGAVKDIFPFVGRQTSILPLLNGMAHFDLLRQEFGIERILGGTCRIFADLDPSGTITQTGSMAEMTFGLLQGQDILPGPVKMAERLREALAPVTGFKMKRMDPIERALWDKWVLLASLASMTCLMRGTVGEIMASDHGGHLMRQAVQETSSIAEANRFPIDSEYHAAILDLLTKKDSPFAASMFKDILKGRKIEADHILGDLLARAKGQAVPLLETAYTHLQVYERRLAQK